MGITNNYTVVSISLIETLLQGIVQCAPRIYNSQSPLLIVQLFQCFKQWTEEQRRRVLGHFQS